MMPLSPEILDAGGEVLGEEAGVGLQVLVAAVALADELQVTQHLALHHLDRVLTPHRRFLHLLYQVLTIRRDSFQLIKTNIE